MNNEEIKKLETYTEFYKKGDLMDELLVDREVELLKKNCISRKNAIEVGCGSGYSTEKLINYFDDFEVLEAVESNIALMKKKINKDIVCHNALLEEFKTEKKYDNIIFFNVLEHVEEPIKCLKALENLLRDEGYIYITAPNCMSLNRRAGYKMGILESYDKFAPKDYLVGHRRLYTVEMMKNHCEDAGLRVVAMKGVYLKPLSEKQMYNLGIDVVKAFYSLGEDLPEYCANIFAVCTKKHY